MRIGCASAVGRSGAAKFDKKLNGACSLFNGRFRPIADIELHYLGVCLLTYNKHPTSAYQIILDHRKKLPQSSHYIPGNLSDTIHHAEEAA